VVGLEVLWRSWERLRQDATTGMSWGWRDHADRNMAVLMDPDGLSPAPSPMLTRTLRVAAAVAL